MTKWITALPCHLHSWYWLWKINRSLYSVGKVSTIVMHHAWVCLNLSVAFAAVIESRGQIVTPQIFLNLNFRIRNSKYIFLWYMTQWPGAHKMNKTWKLSKLNQNGVSNVGGINQVDMRSNNAGEFPAQRASNAKNVSIWWRHHGGNEIKEGFQETYWYLQH